MIWGLVPILLVCFPLVSLRIRHKGCPPQLGSWQPPFPVLSPIQVTCFWDPTISLSPALYFTEISWNPLPSLNCSLSHHTFTETPRFAGGCFRTWLLPPPWRKEGKVLPPGCQRTVSAYCVIVFPTSLLRIPCHVMIPSLFSSGAMAYSSIHYSSLVWGCHPGSAFLPPPHPLPAPELLGPPRSCLINDMISAPVITTPWCLLSLNGMATPQMMPLPRMAPPWKKQIWNSLPW